MLKVDPILIGSVIQIKPTSISSNLASTLFFVISDNSFSSI